MHAEGAESSCAGAARENGGPGACIRDEILMRRRSLSCGKMPNFGEFAI